MDTTYMHEKIQKPMSLKDTRVTFNKAPVNHETTEHIGRIKVKTSAKYIFTTAYFDTDF